MGAEPRLLHAVFFPFQAHGHMIPALDIARLFASRRVRTTIISTPLNAPSFQKSIKSSPELGTPITLEIFPFPAKAYGLPDGVENVEQAVSLNLFGHGSWRAAAPDCLVADMFFPWATDVAAKLNIPRLVFHGTSFFYLCASDVLRLYKPHTTPHSDNEPFSLPTLPHEVKLTRMQLPPDYRENGESDSTRLLTRVKESEEKTYGVIVNSFYELESAYADYYRKVLGRRAWHIGPVSLCNRSTEEKARRGKEAAINEHECLKWLDSKEPNSVVYLCFGSTVKFTTAQLREIALSLEASGQQFIWVVRGCSDDGAKEQQWLPQGFERKMEGKGLVVRGWAPQMLILDHEAIGAFVTHCGWNSTLEGVSAGVPMVTWPVFAEQFFNEKLVTEILNIGIPVGAKQWSETASGSVLVKQEAIEMALRQIMAGEAAEEMRSRAKKLKEMAWRSVEVGGSSYSDLSALIEELSSYHLHKSK
ncbi:hypothetical protein Nepgr_018147 [Nepenthes gracilis]|uniref:Glycosyltransferase n=1 Tax=Nepenthes gracilis TaxID=150966 RepID=A0AAD3XU14_NEPGR|nr:hypothetical protein Nepgr_018147 [Nepenthes gracilis]